LNNLLAKTPPRGWNSWNRFLDSNNRAQVELVTEVEILNQARALVDSGMAEAGYQYVVLDDCFQAPQRDARGRIQSHPERFPSGIKALADEIHSMGLKFGLYSVPGSLTCAQQYDNYQGNDLGSLNREELDAQTFSDWGVDFLKYDWCRAHLNDGLVAQDAFRKMATELEKLDREIVYSISEYGLFESHLWAPEFTNMWRTTDDLIPTWQSVLRTLDRQIGLEKYSRPGAWNDPDMLQVGNGELTDGENRAHFYLWCVLNAPLMAGNDLTQMPDSVRDLITNKAALSVNDDYASSQGKLMSQSEDLEVWGKSLSDGSVAAVYLNRGERAGKIGLGSAVLGIQAQVFEDLTTGADLGLGVESWLEIPPHDAIFIRAR
jgi:hypothetical protein